MSAINPDKLASYLAHHVEGFKGPIELKKFSDGQSNPTFLVQTPETNYVLRRKPPGQLMKSAHAVDREFRVLAALADTDVPVPAVYHLCEDDSVIGSMFYLMEYKQGRIFWDPALPELTPEERRQVYDEMNRVLAAIHSVDLKKQGLEDYGRPGSYFSRQVERWTKQYQAIDFEPIPAMEALIEWLPANMPADDGQVSLIHGDYRIDNMMFHSDRLEIIAVFDWELSTLGHPIADLAYQMMQRYFGPDWKIPGLAGLDLEALGIPSEAEYIRQYCDRMGLSGVSDWPFYLAFSFFRFAAICHGITYRARQGNASSSEAEEVGAMARPLAELGYEIAQQQAAKSK
ncbi:phosphotransferase [Proteobacteria bacterium 005FR1]|nr:phosphotransferase [Proteobacteria bacterium 005FR1]